MPNTFPFLSARLLLALPLAGLCAQAAQAQTAPVFNTVITYPTTGGPSGIATADLNGDGNLDVVTIGGSRATVQLGTGIGTFGPPTSYLTGTSGALVSGPSGLALADVTGDGIPDIVTANASTRTIAVLAGTGAGTFAASVTYPTGAISPGRLAVADVNRDGRPDVVVTTTNNTVSVLLNTGGGPLGHPLPTAQAQALAARPTAWRWPT